MVLRRSLRLACAVALLLVGGAGCISAARGELPPTDEVPGPASLPVAAAGAR